jgi:hypothetical protein
MTKNQLRNRTKFFAASENKNSKVKNKLPTRREPNYVDVSDLNTDNVISDFFEFDKELSSLKPSNKTEE